jgi:TP901 family phage tail tape measure protein
MADLNLQVKLKGVDEGLQKTLLGLETSLKNISEITKGIDFSSIAKIVKSQTSSITSSVQQASSGISKLDSQLAKLEAKTITLNPKNGQQLFEKAVEKFTAPKNIIGQTYGDSVVKGLGILIQADKAATNEMIKNDEKRTAEEKKLDAEVTKFFIDENNKRLSSYKKFLTESKSFAEKEAKDNFKIKQEETKKISDLILSSNKSVAAQVQRLGNSNNIFTKGGNSTLSEMSQFYTKQAKEAEKATNEMIKNDEKRTAEEKKLDAEVTKFFIGENNKRLSSYKKFLTESKSFAEKEAKDNFKIKQEETKKISDLILSSNKSVAAQVQRLGNSNNLFTKGGNSTLSEMSQFYTKQAKEAEKATREAEKAQKAVDNLAVKSNGLFKGFKEGLTSGLLGRGFVSGAGFAAGLASIRAVVGAIGAAKDELVRAEQASRLFERSLREIKSLGTIVDDKQLNEIGNKLKDLSIVYGTDLKSQTEGFYTTVSNGVRDTSEAMAVLNAANTLALSGLGDVNKSVTLLTDTMNVFGKGNITAAEAADLAFNAVNFGKIRVDELTSSMGKILPLGNILGLSFKEMAASLAVLTTQGLSARERVIQLQGVFNQLIKNQDKLPKGLELSTIATKGWVNWLRELEKATKGNVGELASFFTNIRALQGAIGLTGDSTDKLAKTMAEFEKNSNAAQVASEELRKSMQFQSDAITSQYEVSIISYGKTFSGVFLTLKKAAVDFFTYFLSQNEKLSIFKSGAKSQTEANLQKQLTEEQKKLATLQQTAKTNNILNPFFINKSLSDELSLQEKKVKILEEQKALRAFELRGTTETASAFIKQATTIDQVEAATAKLRETSELAALEQGKLALQGKLDVREGNIFLSKGEKEAVLRNIDEIENRIKELKAPKGSRLGVPDGDSVFTGTGSGVSKSAKSAADTYIDTLQKELGRQAKNINLDKVNELLLDKLRIRSDNNLAVKDISQIISSIKGALDAGLVSPSLEGQATYLEKLIGADKIAKDTITQKAKDIKQQVTDVFAVLPSQYDATKGNALIDTIIDDTSIQNKVALLTKIDNLLFRIRGESSELGLKKIAQGANQGLNKIAEELPDSVAKKEEEARARQVKQMETLRSLTEGVSDAFFRAADASESFGTALTKNLQQVAKQIVETYIKTLILNSVLGAFSKEPKTTNGATFDIPTSSGSLLTRSLTGSNATGGEVHGLGSGTSDSNIVALSSGEAVLTARSTRALKKTLGGDIIKKLNRLGGGDFGAVSILSSMANLGDNLDGLGRYASGGEVANSSFPSATQTAGVKIINNTSTPIQQDNVITKRTLEGLVTEIIISDQRSNGSINKSMKSSYGLSQRGVF